MRGLFVVLTGAALLALAEQLETAHPWQRTAPLEQGAH